MKTIYICLFFVFVLFLLLLLFFFFVMQCDFKVENTDI
jgi:hypothetical protein